MKSDVIGWAHGNRTAKIPSKETLNHAELIHRVSGMDPWQQTTRALLGAYQALGIDIVNRVPSDNAPAPLAPGEHRPHPSLPYRFSPLGLYPTASRVQFACGDPDDVYSMEMRDVRYEDLVTPVPHPCGADDIAVREKTLGDIGMYYPMLYTTLFMWGVEVLGWEVFMVSAMMEPDKFHDNFILPCVAKSRRIVETMATTSTSPFVFLHDDLADARGPVFRPAWYDEYVFPHYPEIFEPAKQHGKKVIIVADGNMTGFLPKLLECGVDGIMFESPATPTEAVVEHFGSSGQYFIGGIATAVLSFGTTAEIEKMVADTFRIAGGCPGFALASGGGLHDGIPMPNLEAYFDARAAHGVTPADWRTRSL